jgi:cytochrome c-type biogenesis protein CcmH/NrfG
VTEDDPQNSVAWLWSGMAAAKMEDWQAAEASFKQAERLGHPKAGEALTWLEEIRAED